MPESLDNLFSAGDTQGAESTVDATATQEIDVTTEVDEISQDIVTSETVEPTAEETIQDEPDYKSMFEEEQKKREGVEKQHRDYQSFRDSEFNRLQKQMAEQATPEVKAEETPKLSKEELQDLMYEDPMKAYEYMAKITQPQQQQAMSPEDIQVHVQEGVQREQHDDYDAIIENLRSVASYHPEIIKKINESTNKAKTAYEEGKKLQSLSQPQGDIEALKAQLREELLEEMKTNNKSRPTLRNVPASKQGKAATVDRSFNSLFTAGRKTG